MTIFSSRLIGNLILAAVLFLSLVSKAMAVPSVVVSIPPVHSLVSALMQGAGEPELLIEGGQSPHNSSLKPSAMRVLSQADFIISVSPDFEISLRKPISRQDRAVLLDLVDIPGIHLLDARSSGLWEAGHDHASHEEEASAHSGHQPDFHLWLSPENAEAMVRHIADRLIEMDPGNAQLYSDNAIQTIKKIELVAGEIKHSLMPVKHVPYLVFHDAYHYFEHEFDLTSAGAVTLSPERAPGARTLRDLRKRISEGGAECIFHEPQFQPRLVNRIADESGIRVGELDPMGAGLEPGPELWFYLMLGLRDQLLACLRPPK